MTFRIAIADETDAQDIAVFLAHALPEAWQTTSLPDAAQCRRVLLSDNLWVMLARQHGGVVGMASGWILPNLTGTGDNVMLDELLVASPHRGQGIGSSLVETFIATARQRGTPPVQIWATTDAPEEPAATPFKTTGARSGDLLRQFDWPIFDWPIEEKR